MAEPYAILAVPVAGDPGGLLRVGPSLQLLGPDIAVTRCAHPPRIIWHGSRSDALPLWWAGALVPEGWDRARRVAFDAAGFTGGPGLAATLDSVEVMHPGWEAVLRLARAMESAGLCRVVVLDLVDGVPVERAQ